MRARFAPVAILVAVLCMAAASDPADRLKDPGQEARAKALFSQIRCLVCQNESIDDSEAPLAHDLRQIVRQQVAAGAGDAQVRGFLTDRYGEFVLLKPTFSWGNAALWLAPFLIVVAGLLLWWRRLREASPLGAELSGEEAVRLAELENEDAV